MGLHVLPFRETGLRDFGLYPWWAFCIKNMKKAHIIIATGVLTFVFLAPSIVFATQGACSYHGGVKCTAGATLDGKVTCNDGWVNSSVYFSEMDECDDTNQCPFYVSDSAYQNLLDVDRNTLESEKVHFVECDRYTSEGETFNEQAYQSCMDLMSAKISLGELEEAIALNCANKNLDRTYSNISKKNQCRMESLERINKYEQLIRCMRPLSMESKIESGIIPSQEEIRRDVAEIAELVRREHASSSRVEFESSEQKGVEAPSVKKSTWGNKFLDTATPEQHFYIPEGRSMDTSIVAPTTGPIQGAVEQIHSEDRPIPQETKTILRKYSDWSSRMGKAVGTGCAKLWDYFFE